MIRFRSYKTRNGRNGLLKLALCGMDQANIDLKIMQETNITDVVYMRSLAGVCVVATDAPSHHRRAYMLING